MSMRKVALSHFASHCVEEIAAAQRDHSVLEIVGSDGPVALVNPLPSQVSGTVADWIGSGAGYKLAAGAALEDPAFEPEEWDEFPQDVGA